MVLSKGSLPKVNVLSTVVNESGVTINYQTESAYPGVAADDVVMGVLKTLDGAVYFASKPRGNSETDILLLPAVNVVADDVLYIYLSVVSSDKTKASNTVYVSVV